MNELKMRILQEKDASLMFELMHSPDMYNFFRFNPDSITRESIRAFITNSQTSEDNKHFAVVDESDEYLGTVSLKNIDTVSLNAEFAIILRAKVRGRGVGTFAVYEIFKYAFNELELHKVYLNVYTDNFAAVRLYEKCGFIYEGEFREHVFVKGLFKNIKWFGITKEEYESYAHN